MRTTAVVLAGGGPDEVAALQPGAINKAFVRIGGIALVERTLRALRASTLVGRIIVVAPQAVHADAALAGADERRADGTKIQISLSNGLALLPPDEIVLVSTSDLPILTPDCVDDFIEHAYDVDADIGYGCVERTVHEALFPEVPHTWARLREGTYCGGGLIAIKPRALPALERFIERLGAARKNPLQLASLFGWDVMARFAFGRLSIASAERRASQLLGASVCAIVSPYPETGVNVDRASDVALAERLVSSERADA
ncbi:MAG TPA: NTP transferase domain-containing protein [Candidatus Baltobacteraceae bacterium]|nr:NTP transferase domain-containing protein [Candidatus Baltobacteraceae bacterium]